MLKRSASFDEELAPQWANVGYPKWLNKEATKDIRELLSANEVSELKNAQAYSVSVSGRH
jgi:hypothetical protein